jgi:hypothetical protein
MQKAYLLFELEKYINNFNVKEILTEIMDLLAKREIPSLPKFLTFVKK